MDAPRVAEVTSLPELIEQVTPPAPEASSGRRRSYAVFRGAVRGPMSLLTTLDRLGGVDPPHTKAHLEEHILRNFMRYARPFVGAGNEWDLLFTAQHHGLPTRLLDWTHSPLVAAHFATLGAPQASDRVIWRLDWRRHRLGRLRIGRLLRVLGWGRRARARCRHRRLLGGRSPTGSTTVSGGGAGSMIRGGTGGTSRGGRSTGAAARVVAQAEASSPAASRQANRLNM